jgi:hypothetical protein
MPRAVSENRVTLGSLLIVMVLVAAGADAQHSPTSDKRALAALQAYVGGWRGVAQPKRGSNQGASTQESQWAWKFEGGRAELVADLSKDKYFDHWQLQAGDKPGQFVLLATEVVNGAAIENDAATKSPPRRFTGTLADDALVLTADDAPDQRPARISLRLVAGGDRMLVL